MEDVTPESPNSQEPTQTPSIWDQVDALTPKKNGDIWDRVNAVPDDPRQQAINFNLQDGATRDPQRAAQVIRLARRYNLPEPFVDKGFDKLMEEEKKGNLASQDLLNSNPTLADLIAQSPNYSAAALKHLPTLKQVEMLYTRPTDLWPRSDAQITEQAKAIAKLRAERDWPKEGELDHTYSSQGEMESAYFQEELEKRRNIEAVMAGSGPLGIKEAFLAKHPDSPILANIVSGLPFLRYGPQIAEAVELAEAKDAVRAGTADEIQKDIVRQAQRLEAIEKIRGGKAFLAHAALQGASLPAAFGELAAGGAVGRAGTAALGLTGPATYLAEPAIGALTAGAPEIAQSYVQARGEGESAAEAGAKAVRDSFANYFGAKVVGPWFSKAAPEVQQSVLAAMPKEALKLIGMGAVTEAVRAIGPDAVQHLKDATIARALAGDADAWREILATGAVGGMMGAAGTMKSNRALTEARQNAEGYAQGTQMRGELLASGFAKDFPELAQQLSQDLSKIGPNEYIYLPVRALDEHFGENARAVAGQLLGDSAKYDNAKQTGADLAVPTAAYDRIIGADPGASKFFVNEVRPGPGDMNLREAQDLERAYSAGIRMPARDRVIQQIMEQAQGDKIREGLGRANLEYSTEDLLRDPATLGLSDEQVARTSKAIAEANAHAEETLRAKEQARRDALKSELYTKELERTRAEVVKEVDARPEQIALAYLQKKALPNGTPLSAEQPELKLSRSAVQEMFPGLALSSFPRGVLDEAYPAGNGVHPDAAAGVLGFSSGQDLVNSVINANREKAIQTETDARMAQKFPEGLTAAEMSDEALKALHNQNTAALKRMALQYIAENKLTVLRDMMKVASRRAPPIAEITAAARAEIAGEKLATLNPKRYLAAEERASREAMAAVFKGEWEKVFDAKLAELHAHERFRIAQQAVETDAKRLSKWADLPAADYLNDPDHYDWGQQAKNILRRIGLVAVDPRELATAEPFMDWAKKKFESGETRFETIDIDPKFANPDAFIHYRDLTHADMDSLDRTLGQITHYAKDLSKVTVQGKKLSAKLVAGELAQEVRDNFKEVKRQSLTPGSASVGEKLKAGARSVDAFMDRPEPWFDRNGGGKIDSAWNKQWADYVEARVKEEDLKRRFVEGARDLWAKLPKEEAKAFDRKVTIPGVKIPLSLREIANIVANGGNESSYSKMIRGEAIPREIGGRDIGLTEEKIQEAATHLSEFQKDHVQRILDLTNKFWPEIEDLSRWSKGIAPKKIEAKQMIRAMGDRPGGYYPAMYDARFSKVGEMQLARESEIGQLFPKSWQKATTDSGYMESRIENFAAPMDFDFGRLGSHMNAMVKDLAYRKWILNFNKLVGNAELNNAIKERHGDEFGSFLRDWSKRSIGLKAQPSDGTASKIRAAIGAIRHNITVATLGLRASTALHHALGFDLAIAEIGAKRFQEGMGTFLSSPKERLAQMAEEAPDLAHYVENADPNIHDSIQRLEGNHSAWADFQRLCMRGIQYGNILRAVPTYFGAKAKAIESLSAAGKSGAELESLARQYAQRTVRTTVGSGKAGDLPAIMSSDFAKMMFMFYTPGSLRYAQAKTALGEAIRGDGLGKFLLKGFWMLPAAAALHTLVSQHLPDEDKDETYLGMYAKDMATYPFSALPMGEELARGVVDLATGHKHDFGISSPIFKGMEQAFDTVQKTERWYQDEAEFEDVLRSFSRTAGYWFGAPTEQAEITGGYLLDLARHRGEDPNDFFEFMHDLLWRRPKWRRP